MTPALLCDSSAESVQWLSKRLQEIESMLRSEALVTRKSPRNNPITDQTQNGHPLIQWVAAAGSMKLIASIYTTWTKQRRFLQLRYTRGASIPADISLPCPDQIASLEPTDAADLLRTMRESIQAGSSQEPAAVAALARLSTASRAIAIDHMVGSDSDGAIEVIGCTPWTAPRVYQGDEPNRKRVLLTPQGTALLNEATGPAAMCFTINGSYTIAPLTSSVDMPLLSAIDILRAMSEIKEGYRLCEPHPRRKTSP